MTSDVGFTTIVQLAIIIESPLDFEPESIVGRLILCFCRALL